MSSYREVDSETPEALIMNNGYLAAMRLECYQQMTYIMSEAPMSDTERYEGYEGVFWWGLHKVSTKEYMELFARTPRYCMKETK